MPKKLIEKQEVFFLDTAFVQALLNPRDQYHLKALELAPRFDKVWTIWTTRIILIEIADGLSAIARPAVVNYIRSASKSNRFKIVEVDEELHDRGLALFESRMDKDWGLTDCISFIVMRDKGLTDALTSDQHFVQAGFRALMRDE